MTLQEYIASIRDKTVAIVGIGVSNTPLIELLAKSGVRVTACDRKSREDCGRTFRSCWRRRSGGARSPPRWRSSFRWLPAR